MTTQSVPLIIRTEQEILTDLDEHKQFEEAIDGPDAGDHNHQHSHHLVEAERTQRADEAAETIQNSVDRPFSALHCTGTSTIACVTPVGRLSYLSVCDRSNT